MIHGLKTVVSGMAFLFAACDTEMFSTHPHLEMGGVCEASPCACETLPWGDALMNSLNNTQNGLPSPFGYGPWRLA